MTESHQTRFAAYLSKSVSSATIRSYLCAVRFLQIRAGLPDPSQSSPPRLAYVLKGIQRNSPSHGRMKRLPLTPDLLLKIHALWSNHPISFDKVMLWAAFCTGFFGFMRSGEFTFSASGHEGLSVDDIAIDSRQDPQIMTILLRRSKTDPFGTGTRLYLGRTGNKLCPISAMLAYLAIRPHVAGPLFILQDGTPLTRGRLVTHLRQALSQLNVNATNFSGHSFRIGAATAAARAGLSDSLIQSLGRWKSSAFTAYIRTQVDELIAAPAAMSTLGTNLTAPSPAVEVLQIPQQPC